MAKQSFAPTSTTREVKSHLVKTPGLINIRHHFLVRLLIVERVRCIMDDVPFAGGQEQLVAKYLVVPEHYTDMEQVDRYVKSETAEVLAAFNAYEKNPSYIDDLAALSKFRGHRWHLVSATDSGVLITVELGS